MFLVSCRRRFVPEQSRVASERPERQLLSSLTPPSLTFMKTRLPILVAATFAACSSPRPNPSTAPRPTVPAGQSPNAGRGAPTLPTPGGAQTPDTTGRGAAAFPG